MCCFQESPPAAPATTPVWRPPNRVVSSATRITIRPSERQFREVSLWRKCAGSEGRVQTRPLWVREQVFQFLEAVHDHIGLKFPGIEDALAITLHPDGAQAASLRADHVKGIRGNHPQG